MKAEIIDLMIDESLAYFFIQKKPLKLKRELKKIALRAKREAKKTYQKLKPPKIVPQKIYLENWIREALLGYLAAKTLRRIKLNQPPFDLQAIAKFHLLFPPQTQAKLRKQLFAAQLKKRPSIWQNFGLPLQKLEKVFKKVIKEREKNARQKGFSSFPELLLQRYRIPKKDYQLFIKGVDQLIAFLNQPLSRVKNLPPNFYSRFNLPCFLCLSSQFPFQNLSEVINWLIRQNALLARFRHKFTLKLNSQESQLIYLKENDCFKIILNKKINFRHQVLDLIHEASHLILNLKSFKSSLNPQAKGSYWREREAFKIEWQILQKAPPPLFLGFLTELLLNLRIILFEIELYTNPDQDLSQLYAQTFNRCFKGAKQKRNPLYLLNSQIVFRPFRSLPHIIGCYNFYHELQKES